MNEFDDALALDPLQDGTFAATLTDDWAIGHAVNGGVLMALCAKAAGVVGKAGHDHPLSLSAVFLSPGLDGSSRVAPMVLREGKRMSTVSVDLVQHGELRVRSLVTTGHLDDHAEPVRAMPPAPRIAPVEKCVSMADAPEGSVPEDGFFHRYDLRLDPDHVGWAVGAPSGRGELLGWIRLADGRDPDPLSVLAAMDAFPPVAFDHGARGWVPTVEFTGYVRGVPAPGWLCVRTQTTTLTGGLHEEDCQVWDSTGRLVGQSRQLASARF